MQNIKFCNVKILNFKTNNYYTFYLFKSSEGMLKLNLQIDNDNLN
jgi:hypothetical protein